MIVPSMCVCVTEGDWVWVDRLTSNLLRLKEVRGHFQWQGLPPEAPSALEIFKGSGAR